MYCEASLRQSREDTKRVDVLAYSFQLLHWYESRVGIHAAVVRDVVGSIEKFAGCDYGSLPAIEAIL